MPALRRRTASFLEGQNLHFRAFVRAVPLLFIARLRRPSLDVDPPGLVRAPRRRRWGRLCEQLDLPPPTTWTAFRPLVQCLVLAPTPHGKLELLIVPIEGLSRQELARVSARVEATTHLAARHAPGLEVRMASLWELTPSLFAWAAVVGGEIPLEFSRQAGAETSFDWLDVVMRAPSALHRCLATLVPRTAEAPLDALRQGAPAARGPFLASWSGEALVRDVVSLNALHFAPAEFDGLIRRLRLGCAATLRRLPREERRLVYGLLREQLWSRRVPRVFSAHLERLIKTRHVREVQSPDDWRVEIEGFVVARAASLDQLRAFALAESRALVSSPSQWARLSPLLEGPARTHGLLVIEPGFLRHLAVRVPKSGRPRVRRVDATHLIQLALQWHREGVPLELVTTAGADPRLVARLSQILKLRLEGREAVAIQLGAQVLIASERSRVAVFPLERAFSRPRRVRWVPESAEELRALRAPMVTSLPTVHVVALPHGDAHAAVFALDAEGHLFRDEVPRDQLQLTLHDFREILKGRTPQALVSAAVHPLLTSLDGRRSQAHEPLVLELELLGAGARVRFGDEWFGTGADLSWSALAEAVLSQWAPGVWAPLSIIRVLAPAGTAPLTLLAARSRVIRRVETHLSRIARSLRAA